MVRILSVIEKLSCTHSYAGAEISETTVARSLSDEGDGTVADNGERRNRQTPYEAIKHAILTAEFPSGQQLVETELAAKYNMSRTPVREALMRLEHDGLVARLDRTHYVRTRSREEVLDIYDTRIVVETHAARLAADRRSSNDLLFLKQIADRMAARKPRDVEAMADINEAFHRRIWQCTRSETLIDLLERVNLHLARYPASTLSFPGRWDEANQEHYDLLDALEKRDVDRAGEITTAHFAKARDIRLELWSNEDFN